MQDGNRSLQFIAYLLVETLVQDEPEGDTRPTHLPPEAVLLLALEELPDLLLAHPRALDPDRPAHFKAKLYGGGACPPPLTLTKIAGYY